LVSVPLSIKNPELAKKINVEGTRNVLETALKHNVKRVVFASSAAVYGNNDKAVKETDELRPQDPYGESKKEAEMLMRSYFEENGLETVSLRYFNVYGPRQNGGVIKAFLNSTTPTIYGDGNQSRDFIYVNDVVRANLLALSAKPGEAFNVGTGVVTSMLSLIDTLSRITGKKYNPSFAPERKNDIRYSCADTEKAEKILGFKAETTIEEGLRRTIEAQ
jgi:UDP-glucose 4-epimerase